MTGEEHIRIEADTDIVRARKRGRELCARLGFGSTDQTLVALAISEIARNIVTYAGRGDIRIAPFGERGRRGVRIVAHDRGPGIADLELAMQDGYSTSRSLGLGLPGAKRVMDAFEIQSTVGEGTTITMTKWLAT